MNDSLHVYNLMQDLTNSTVNPVDAQFFSYLYCLLLSKAFLLVE